MNNFTKRSENASWQFITNLTCGFTKRIANFRLSAMSSMLVMLFLFNVSAVNAQLNQLNQKSTDLNLCYDQIPDALPTEEIAKLFEDVCGDIAPEVTLTEIVNGDDCSWDAQYIYDVTCGDFSDQIKIVYTGGDQTPPELDKGASIPEGETGVNTCLSDRPEGPSEDDIAALFVDNCGDVIVTKSASFKGDDCGWKGMIVYTVSDACGNSLDNIILDYTGGDSEDPVLDTIPEDFTVECFDEIPSAQSITFTDNCTDGKNKADTSDDVSGLGEGCEGGVILRTWTATDDCGNSTSYTITITVLSANPAEFDVAEDYTIDCGALATFEPQFLAYTNGGEGSCVISGEVQGVAEAFEGSCGSFQVNYSFTDECGREITASQIVTVEDNTPPVMDPTAKDAVVECDGEGNVQQFQDWIDAHAEANATDDCGEVTWSHEIVVDLEECGATKRYEVVFTATDDCGNSSATKGIFIIEDTTNPNIDQDAIDVTVECDGNGNADVLAEWLANNGGALASDMCSDVVWSNNYEALSDDCGATGSATVEFTATDDCGNESKTTATFTIEDTTNPSIDTDAMDMTVECDGAGNADALAAWLASNGGAMASDSCSDVVWSNNYEALSDDCGATGSATVEFTATDDCGNESKTTATFTIEDTTNPSIDTEAMDMTVECDGAGNADALTAWLASNGGAMASDSCSDVVWSNNYEALSDDCGATGSATVEFTATDDCGNESKTTATFTIEDTTNPSIDTEAMDMTVECDGAGNADALAAWLASNGGAMASDSCSDVVWSNNYEALSDDCGATGSATVEFTATDDCGNESKTTATFTIEDTTNPSIDTEAMDMTVECDGAGNADALAAWLASNGGAMASDSCSDVVWSNNYEALSDDCGATGSATVEFTATDDCGNESKTTATFTIEDTTNPSIDTGAMDMTVECDGEGNAEALAAWLASNGGAMASDSCGDLVWSNNYEVLSDDCGATGSATVEFTATDDCGNDSKTTATFTIEDTTNPSIDTGAMDMTVECDGEGNAEALAAWLASNGGAMASDSCGDLVWSNNYEVLSDDCGATGSATVEFTATDDCGNDSKTTATFTIEDTTDPVLEAGAKDIVTECGEDAMMMYEDWLAANGEAIASDSCGDVTWSYDVITEQEGCGSTMLYIVIFTAADECGNSIDSKGEFTIEDTTDPSIDTEAMDMTVECDGNGNADALAAWLASNGGAMASDSCGDVVWSNNYEVLSDDCGATGSATVEFTATDDCGNDSKTTATFTIEDTTNPSIDTEAMDMTVECDGAGNADALAAWLASNGGASASDLCSDVVWSNNYEALSEDCGATGSATVEFTATDDCGNDSKTTATFTIEDTTNPVFDELPGAIVIECEDDLPNGDITASDNCGNAIVTYEDETSTGEEGEASTECSTSDASNHTLWINNKGGIGATNKNFVATSAGSFITYPDGTAKLTGSVANTNNPNQKFDFEAWFTNKSTYAEWTTIPNAGSSTGFRQVKLEAGTSVEITDEYLDWHYYEMDPSKNNVLIGQGDYAGVEFMLMHNPADYRYGLQIGEKASLQSEGYGVSTWIGIAGLFNGQPYSSNGDFNISLENCEDNSGCAPTIVTRTYTATDDCGNTATHVQTITIEDNTPPTIDTTAKDTVVECDGEGNQAEFQAWIDSNAEASASDACGDVTWSYEIVVEDELCGDTMHYEVVFTATDDCGNSASTKGQFTIEDTTDPVLEAGAKDIVTECGEDAMMMYQDWLAANGEAIASDSCGDVTWSYDVITEQEGCGSSMFYIVIFTATDDCGNSIDSKGEFTIEDTTDPIINTEASDLTIGCGGNNGNCSYTIQGFDSYGDGWNGAIMNVYVNGELVLEYGFNNGHTGPVQQVSVANDDIITLEYASYGQYPGELSYKLRDSDGAIVIHGYKQGCEVTAECDDSGSSDTTLEEWLLSNGGASATDSCGDVTWSNNYDGQSEGCGQTVVTFTATDDCGNASTTEAIYTIEGSEITLECSEGGDLGHCPSADPNTGIPYAIADKANYSDDCGNEGITSNFTDEYSYVLIEGNDGEVTFRCTYNGYVTDYDFHYAGWHNNRPWYEGYVNGIYFQLYYYGSGWTMYCVPDGQHFWYTTNDNSYKVPCDFDQYINNTNCSVEVICEQTPDLVEHTLTRTFTKTDNCGNEASCDVTYTWTTPNNYGYSADTASDKSDSNPCGIVDPTVDLADGPGNTTANADVDKGIELDFTAYPVPFDREVTIKFNFEFDTDVTINVHDTRGLLIKTEIMNNVRANSSTSTKLDLSRGGDQVFYVTVTTNQGSVTKKIVSSGMKR